VDVARDLEVEQIGTVLRVIESVGGGLVNRHRHGLGRRVRRVAGVNGKGVEFMTHCMSCLFPEVALVRGERSIVTAKYRLGQKFLECLYFYWLYTTVRVVLSIAAAGVAR